MVLYTWYFPKGVMNKGFSAQPAQAPWAPRFENMKELLCMYTHTHTHTVFYMKFCCLDQTECLLIIRLRVKGRCGLVIHLIASLTTFFRALILFYKKVVTVVTKYNNIFSLCTFMV